MFGRFGPGGVRWLTRSVATLALALVGFAALHHSLEELAELEQAESSEAAHEVHECAVCVFGAAGPFPGTAHARLVPTELGPAPSTPGIRVPATLAFLSQSLPRGPPLR